MKKLELMSKAELKAYRTDLHVKCVGSSYGGPAWTKEDQKEWEKVERLLLELRKVGK